MEEQLFERIVSYLERLNKKVIDGVKDWKGERAGESLGHVGPVSADERVRGVHVYESQGGVLLAGQREGDPSGFGSVCVSGLDE